MRISGPATIMVLFGPVLRPTWAVFSIGPAGSTVIAPPPDATHLPLPRLQRPYRTRPAATDRVKCGITAEVDGLSGS